jgi:Domain of unknown function (DUF1707)/Protein of unknown function (DUF2516)
MEGFLLVGVGVLVALGVPLWAIIDASRRPASSFDQIGSDKSRWVLLLVLLAILFNIGGIVAAGVYLVTVRPKLASIHSRPTAPPLLLDPSASELLASDAEREHVTNLLQRSVAEGRLSLADFELRLDRALRAHTFGELAPLIRDLPPLSP